MLFFNRLISEILGSGKEYLEDGKELVEEIGGISDLSSEFL